MKRLAIAALLLFGFLPSLFADPVGVGVGIGRSSMLAVDDGALPTYDWTPLQIPNIVFYGQSWNTGSMWVENSAGTPTTRPTADGDAIGYIDEPVGGFAIASGADNARPTLSSDATVNSSLLYDSNNESQDVLNSESLFSFFQRTRQGTILFKIKFNNTAGGTANAILDTANGASTGHGFYVRRNTNGTLLFQIMGGSSLISFSSTSSVASDTNWHYVRIWAETSGTVQVHIRIDGGNDDASTALGSAVASNNTSPLRIGNRTSGSTTMDAKIADLVITTSANVSDSDYNLWLAHNPSRSSTVTAMERITASGDELTPAQVTSFYYSGYDLSDVTKLWTTSAAAVQVSADADKIGYILNSKSAPVASCLWQRDGTQAVDAKRPAYRTNQSNGLGAGQWTGTATTIGSNDGLSDYTGEQNIEFTQWSRGAETFIVVMRNDRTDPGSQPLTQGYAIYSVMVGSAYSGGTSDNQFIQHFSGGDAADSPVSLNGGEGMNILCVRKDGATATAYLNNYRGETSTNAGQFIAKQMGRPGIEDIDMNGEIFQVERWNQCLSENTCRKLVNGLATKYGVPNVTSTIVLAATPRRDWYKRMLAEATGYRLR